MKVLVTGATGFIGSHLVENLSRKGVKIRCLVRPTSDISFLKTLKNIEFFEGDLLKIKTLEKAVQGVEKVFHLAAVSHTFEDVDYSFFRKNNVIPSVNLAKVAMEKGVKRFIFFSSIEAVGLKKAANISRPINESVVPSPETKYGKSKLEVEEFLISLYKKSSFPMVIIRPTIIYGPRDVSHGPLKFFKSIKSGMFRFVGNGRNLVSWCYVKNLIEATLLAAEKKNAEGQIYFINDEKPYRFEKLVKTAAKHLRVKVSDTKIPLFLAKIVCFPIENLSYLLKIDPPISKNKIRLATQNFVYNISKAQKELGYKQIFSLDRGLKETIYWYQKNGYL